MKLRVRIALIALAVIVPLGTALGVLLTSLRGQTFNQALTQYAHTTAATSRADCEADPQGWSGPVKPGSSPDPLVAPGLEVYAYDAALRASHASAPALPPAALAEVQAGRPYVAKHGDIVQVLVRGAEAGPCTYVLVQRPTRPGSPQLGLPGLVALACALLVLGVVLALLGPIVRRIHRLRDEVRTAAASGYRDEVTVRGDDELAELAAAFVASGREIAGHIAAQAQRERTLRDFLANTTHDVLTPLTVLQGHLATLHARGAPEDAAAVRAAMQEADYIAALVRNLEIAALLDAGEPELARDPVELSPVIARVISRHTPLARRRGVALVHAVPGRSPVVVGDLTMIEQAIGNLVQNAVLHNHPGGHVALILEMEDARRFRVAVKDDGPGIAPEALARLLGRGERGDEARTRHPHGKGLGLAIVRRVAAAHDWRFELRPGAEGGLEVELVGVVIDAPTSGHAGTGAS